MRVVIIGLVIVAVILAGGTAYLLRGFLNAQQDELAAAKPKAPTVNVLIAASDMPVGTVVNENNTEWLEWPKDNVPEGFLVKADGADPLAEIGKEKHLARRGFTKGEPITMARLYKSDNPGFLRGSLEPGMRAVAVRTSAEIAAGGFILPGDRVDIVLTHELKAIQDQAKASEKVSITGVSETILENIRVLAVDQKTNEFEGGAAVGKTILLEVTPKQAEIINTAKSMGTVNLTLRSAEEGDKRVGVPFTTDVEVSPLMSAIAGSSGGGAPAAAPAPTAPRPTYTAPAPAKKTIKIYRGGQPGAATQ